MEKERLQNQLHLAARKEEEPSSKTNSTATATVTATNTSNSSFAPGFYDPEAESSNNVQEKSNNDPENNQNGEFKDSSSTHQQDAEILELSDGEDYLEPPAPQGPSDWDAAILVEDLIDEDDSEETKDDTKEAMKQSILSSMTNDFNAEFVASLPSTQRTTWVEDARRKQRMQSRQEFMQVAADPQGLSICQLRNFCKFPNASP